MSENVKKLIRAYPDLEKQFPGVDWNEIIRFRDLVSHHYDLLDHEIIYSICKFEIPVLQKAIQEIVKAGL